jgi:predicted GH43/DUF377 family glycosyl hydrolase
MKFLLCIFLACLMIFLIVWKRESKELDPRLHDLADSAIVFTRKIQIPGYPKAFNPSLIPFQDGYLLSFRTRHRAKPGTLHARRKDVSFLGVVQLDRDFRVIEKSAQLLDVTSYADHFSSTAEDGRLFKVGSRIFIFFNDFPISKNKGYALYFAELIEKESRFVFKEPAKQLQYAQAISIEKNWSPFSSGDKIYLTYSDQPRVILEVDIKTGDCKQAARYCINWQWQWGEIRGGTPALQLGETLLTFFHSSIPSDLKKSKGGRLYMMGAYIFDAHFPFTPQRVTALPLGEKEYYTKENRHNVVFPGGIAIKEDLIHVAWGKNNKQIYITTFEKSKLLNSLGFIK